MIEVSPNWLLALGAALLVLQAVVLVMGANHALEDSAAARAMLYAAPALLIVLLVIPYARAAARGGADEVLSTSRGRGSSRVEDMCRAAAQAAQERGGAVAAKRRK
jgi:hypothetical protein